MPQSASARIITQRQADLTGDGSPETITLTGVPIPDSAAWEDICLRVRDGASGLEAALPLPENIGYIPRLWIGSLIRPGQCDLLVSIDSGGSGAIGYYTAYASQNGAYRAVFETAAYNAEYSYAVAYQNGYTVLAKSLANRAAYLIDLADRPASYLGELYQSDGVLLTPRFGSVNPLSLLYPADLDGDGVCELVAYQRITGLYNADALGHFINTLSWDGMRFSLRSQSVGVTGVAF